MDEAHAGSKGHNKYVPWALTMQWWRSDNTEIRNPHLEEKPAKPPKQGTAGKKWTQKSGDYGGGLESKVYLLEEKVMELQQEVQMLSGTEESQQDCGYLAEGKRGTSGIPSCRTQQSS